MCAKKAINVLFYDMLLCWFKSVVVFGRDIYVFE